MAVRPLARVFAVPALTFSPLVWRILVGLSLVPAFGTLYQRLTLPEATRYEESRKNATRIADEESIDELKKKSNADPAVAEKPVGSNASHTSDSSASSPTTATTKTKSAKELAAAKKGHFRDFYVYFSEWRHLKVLIGTCTCWFLLDIAFYGINLNQNVVLQQIGFDGSSGSPWTRRSRPMRSWKRTTFSISFSMNFSYSASDISFLLSLARA